MYEIGDGRPPLVVVDPVKGCCGREYERPKWNLSFSRVRRLIPRLSGFVARYRGYFTLILSDLVESMDDPVKQRQKRFLLGYGWPLMYGHVMTSGEFLRLLE